MSQFEKAVKLSDKPFLPAVGVDKTAFNLILEPVAAYFENVREERPMKKRGKKSEVALTNHLLLTFPYLGHYPTFAMFGTEFGIRESYANKIYHQILDVLVKVLSLKNRKQLLESNLQTVIIDATEQPKEGHRLAWQTPSYCPPGNRPRLATARPDELIVGGNIYRRIETDNCHKVYCNSYREIPSLLPFPGDGERQAPLSRGVASCRGKDYWMRQALEPAEIKERRITLFSINCANA